MVIYILQHKFYPMERWCKGNG